MRGLPTENITAYGQIIAGTNGVSAETPLVEFKNDIQLMGAVQFGSDAGNITVKLVASDDAAGSSTIDVPYAVVPEISGATASEKVLLVSLPSQYIPEGFTYVKMVVTASAATAISGVIYGVEPRHAPVDQPDDVLTHVATPFAS